jgi:hypothetical protein
MTDANGSALTCGQCENEVEKSDEFCPNCGSLFAMNIYCNNHTSIKAEGVCIICCTPFCSECGKWKNHIFLCSIHINYEIYQGMARVFGVSDEAQAQYIASCLEQVGLHPFVFSRKTSPISLGGPEYTLFSASGEFDGHIINEIKVMVPVQEVQQAEEVVRNLGLDK